MDLPTAEFLCSSTGQKLLEDARQSQKTDFALAGYLRAQTTAGFAAAISTVLELRKKAAVKFTRAEQMLFTRSALEQASAEDISRHRLQRLLSAGIESIADLGCAIGGDSIAFSSSLRTTGVELDPARLRLAEYNIAVYDNSASFTPLNQDITLLNPRELAVESFFIDPARRTATGRRLFSPESWSPKLSEISRWLEIIPNGIVKAAPGIDHNDIPQDAEAEFISCNNELRECVLWFGNLKNGNRRQATLLPSGATLTGENPPIAVEDIKEYIYEPDSAVIRAGLVELLAERLQATKISAAIAFLSNDRQTATPFASCYRVLSTFRYSEKELKKELRRLDCGSLNISKRGSPIDIPTLQKKLKLKGSRNFTLLLTRSREDRIAIITEAV